MDSSYDSFGSPEPTAPTHPDIDARLSALSRRISYDRYQDDESFDSIRKNIRNFSILQPTNANIRALANDVSRLRDQVSNISRKEKQNGPKAASSPEMHDVHSRINRIEANVANLEKINRAAADEAMAYSRRLYDEQKQRQSLTIIEDDRQTLKMKKMLVNDTHETAKALYHISTYGKFDNVVTSSGRLSMQDQKIGTLLSNAYNVSVVIHISILQGNGRVQATHDSFFSWDIVNNEIHVILSTAGMMSIAAILPLTNDSGYINHTIIMRYYRKWSEEHFRCEAKILSFDDLSETVEYINNEKELETKLTRYDTRFTTQFSVIELSMFRFSEDAIPISIVFDVTTDTPLIISVCRTFMDAMDQLFMLNMSVLDDEFSQIIIPQVQTHQFSEVTVMNAVSQILMILEKMYDDVPLRVTKTMFTSVNDNGDNVPLSFRPTLMINGVELTLRRGAEYHPDTTAELKNSRYQMSINTGDDFNVGSGTHKVYVLKESKLLGDDVSIQSLATYKIMIIPDADTCEYAIATAQGVHWNKLARHTFYSTVNDGSMGDRSHGQHIIQWPDDDLYLYLLMNLQSNKSHVLITIHPGDALPSVGRIVEKSTVSVRIGNEVRNVNIMWQVLNVRDGDVTQFVILGKIMLYELFNTPKMVYKVCPIVSAESQFSMKANVSHRDTGVSSTPENSMSLLYGFGEVTMDSTSQMTSNIKIKITGKDHAITQLVPNNVRFKLHLQSTIYMLSPSDAEFLQNTFGSAWRDAQTLSVKGVGANIVAKLEIPSRLFTCTYLKDPLHVGNVVTIDQNILRNTQMISQLNSALKDVYVLIDDLSLRLELIEDTVKRLSSAQDNTAGLIGGLSMVVGLINPVAGVVMALAATLMSVVEMSQHGVTMEGVVSITGETLSMLVAFKTHLNKPRNFVRITDTQERKSLIDSLRVVRKKYDAIRVSASAAIQRKIHKIKNISYKKLPVEEIPLTGMLQGFEVEHLYRPMEMFEQKTRYFSNLMRKNATGEANAIERNLFKALGGSRVYPAHQLMRLSNFEHEHNRTVKNVYIYGIADGFAQASSAHLIGNGKSNFFRLNSMHGENVGPGVWKIRMEKNEDSWDILPYRSSGMTGEEILIAGGMTVDGARNYLKKVDPLDLDSHLNFIYAKVSQSLISEYDKYTVRRFPTQLMAGQLESLTAAIKSPVNDYHYTLIGNNCQTFVSSITKLLQDPSTKPKWMSAEVYKKYLRELDDNFAEYL